MASSVGSWILSKAPNTVLNHDRHTSLTLGTNIVVMFGEKMMLGVVFSIKKPREVFETEV